MLSADQAKASPPPSEGAAKSPNVIDLKDYTVDIKKSLGRGGQGAVYKGQHKTANDTVAVKKIKITECECEGKCRCKQRYVEREKDFADTFQQCSHENIVKFIGMETKANNCYIMLELCDQDLNSVFKEAKQEIPFDRCVKYMSDMSHGVEYLHKENIVHRDLKPQNVLQKGDQLKIADFGIARLVSENSTVTTHTMGTPYWLAPECHTGSKQAHELPVDVYALGLMFVSILRHQLGEDLDAPKGECLCRLLGFTYFSISLTIHTSITISHQSTT